MESQGPKDPSSPSLGERFANFFHRTWEMELLLFGFVLVGLWEVPDQLYLYIQKLTFLYPLDYIYYLILLVAVLRLGVFITILGMLLHLALRGFWIATVGLYSSFPSGIDRSKLRMNQRFERFFSKQVQPLGTFEEKLDDLCSANFALTFLLFFTWWGIMASVLLLGVIFDQVDSLLAWIDPPSPLNTILAITIDLVFVILTLLYAFDYFSNGRMKRVKAKWIAVPYYYWYRFMGAITLAFLYRPLYYTFITQKTRRFLPFLIAILCILFFGFGGTKFNPQAYFPKRSMKSAIISSQDYVTTLAKRDLIVRPIIPRKKVENDRVELFLPYNSGTYDDLIDKHCEDVDTLRRTGFHYLKGIPLGRHTSVLKFNFKNEDRDRDDHRAILRCVEEKIDTIFIDSNRIEGLEFKFYRHPRNDVPGFLTYVPLKGLYPGWHELRIQEGGSRETRIPFYYDPASAEKPWRPEGKRKGEVEDTGSARGRRFQR